MSVVSKVCHRVYQLWEEVCKNMLEIMYFMTKNVKKAKNVS